MDATCEQWWAWRTGFIGNSVLAACPFFGSKSASAANIAAGFIAWDVNFPGNAAEFDIINQTGPNASIAPDSTFPITSELALSGLGLTVHFSNGSTMVFGPSYFTLGSDGESFNGSPIPIGGTNPLPTSATLTGNFSPLAITLNSGGGSQSILSGFSSTVTPSSGSTLADGDLALINVTTATVTTTVPEPGTWLLTILGGGCLAFFRRRRLAFRTGKLLKGVPCFVTVLACVWCVLVTQSVSAANLNTWTSPDNGVAGVNDVNVVGTGFPSGTITATNVTISLYAGACGSAVTATTTAHSVRAVTGTARRFDFMIPGTLGNGIYNVAVSDTVAGDANFDTRGTSCSQINVSHANLSLACLPTSALAVVLSPVGAGKVTAYVPQGDWGGGSTGVQAVDLELGSSKTAIATPNVVNSCASNPATGQTVCTANNTDVYLITGTTLNTKLNSGSNGFASFSGGDCNNCGVAINALRNKAVITVGLSASPTGSGVQILDLNTNTFSAPVNATQGTVSEDILIDATRNLILSPGEQGVYDIFQIQADGVTLKEFASVPNTDLFNDSAAEDCSTGIALTVDENSTTVFLQDLTRIALGTTTYTAPHSTVTLTTAYSFFGGSSAVGAVAVAPGTLHLADGGGGVRRQQLRGASTPLHEREADAGDSRLRSRGDSQLHHLRNMEFWARSTYSNRIHQPQRREGVRAVRERSTGQLPCAHRPGGGTCCYAWRSGLKRP